MDARKIEELFERYRWLSADAIALLDEDRHTLTGEEAAALDRVMQDPKTKQGIQSAIAQLDLRKRRSFRLSIVEVLIYAFLTGTVRLFTGPDRNEAYAVLGVAIVLYAWLLRPRLLRLMAQDVVAASGSVDRL